MSTLSVDTIQGQTTAANVKMPAGTPVQVISTTKTDTFTTSSASYVDITGMTATITPKYATSKILVTVNCNWGGVNNIYASIILLRGSTRISASTGGTGNQTNASMAIGGDNNNFQWKVEHTGLQFLDSPATTSATTYKLQVKSTGGPGTNTFYLNRPHQTDNSAYNVFGTSHITLTEIAQ